MDFIENLRIFKRVAELESFTEASREFRVSPPTISKAIKALEGYLGVTLLRRTTRGLSLTSEGQKLLFAGGNLIEQTEAVLSSVRNDKRQLQGQLRISVSLAFSRLVLGPILNEFSDLHPRLRLSFHVSDGYVDLVESGIDLAIRVGEQPDSTLKALKVGAARRTLYASKDYLKKFGIPKTIADLRKHRLLFYTRISDRPIWPLRSPSGEPTPFEFEPFFQTDGSDLLREMVVRGMGIALLPTWMMGAEEDQKTMVRVLEKNSQQLLPIYLMSSNTQALTAKQRTFTEFLMHRFDACKELTLQERRTPPQAVRTRP